jgi:biopolymer transport protein ExbD
MRFPSRRLAPPSEGDMTPMIDMTFQLIAFFMVLISFSDAEMDERVRLPSSELAKPPDAPFDLPLTLQLSAEGAVLFAGEAIPVREFRSRLAQERDATRKLGSDAADTTVIIRAHRDVRTGLVQELIQMCQETGFQNFAVRAMQEEREGQP